MADEILQAYNLIRSGNPFEAKAVLEPVLVYELDNGETLFAVGCCNFWIDAIKRAEEIDDFFERGETYINEWKSFLIFLKRGKKIFERTMFAVRTGVFTLALDCYNRVVVEKNSAQKAEIQRKIGLCYKKLGEFEMARNCLAEALSLKNDSAPIIAEAADCYALCSEERHAKVLFREAFFVDAQKIDLEFLDSELIKCLVRNVMEKGFSGTALLEWIPVYGQLFGIFTVKRRLKPQEIARLKGDVYAAEIAMKAPSCQVELLTPRLINLYFWLIDYYVSVKEDIKKTNEILTRIKILDTEIYEMYVK